MLSNSVGSPCSMFRAAIHGLLPNIPELFYVVGPDNPARVCRYLAKSGPSLVQATAIVAAILWYDDAKRLQAIAATGLLPEEGVDWGKIELAQAEAL